MKMPSRRRPLWSPRMIFGSALLAGVFALTGCNGEGLAIPFELESDEYEINVDDKVLDFEVNACADEESQNCRIIKALDEADDGVISNPPSIPLEFETEIDLEECDANGACISTTIDLADWIDAEGLGIDVSNQLSSAVEVDVREQVGEELDAVGDPADIDQVTITRLSIDYKENTLSFDVPAVDLYIGNGALGDDAAALINSGAVTKVGTLQRRSEGTGRTNVEFVSGGQDRFSDALKSLAFTAVVAVPDTETIELRQGAAAGTLLKPAGEALVTLQAEITFTLAVPEGPFQITLPE